MPNWSDLQKQQSKETVHVVFILDESGSMFGETQKVISGFNENLQDMRRDTQVNYRVTLIKFSYEAKTVFRDLPLSEVREIGTQDYIPSGSTALLDAVGGAIEFFSPEKRNVMIIVATDGEENASFKYNHSRVQELIKSRQDVNKWAFVFLGANANAWSQASKLGVYSSNAMNYRGATAQSFGAMKSARYAYATNVAFCATNGGEVDNQNLVSNTVAEDKDNIQK